jgi:hypothetical protein
MHLGLTGEVRVWSEPIKFHTCWFYFPFSPTAASKKVFSKPKPLHVMLKLFLTYGLLFNVFFNLFFYLKHYRSYNEIGKSGN